MPPEAAVTNLKPDLVILDRKTRTLSIFELTVPNESRIEVSHNLKAEKYQHFLADVTQFKPFVIPFEIGSVSGHISLENKPRIAKIHKFCKPNIKLKNFMQNISAISVLSSYYIFNCRNTELWDTPNFIPAPFKQWISPNIMYMIIHPGRNQVIVTSRKACGTPHYPSYVVCYVTSFVSCIFNQ